MRERVLNLHFSIHPPISIFGLVSLEVKLTVLGSDLAILDPLAPCLRGGGARGQALQRRRPGFLSQTTTAAAARRQGRCLAASLSETGGGELLRRPRVGCRHRCRLGCVQGPETGAKN